MPKLHFHDTGLACWLLGIRTTTQLHSHPLRGAIFETWVASEVRKHRANCGELRAVSFYRDRGGVEGDLIVEAPNHLTVVEAKAAATPSSGLLGSVERVRTQLADAQNEVESIVVYGGNEAQHRSNTRLVPWNTLHALDWVR